MLWVLIRIIFFEKIPMSTNNIGFGREHMSKNANTYFIHSSQFNVLLAHLSMECSVSYCDHSPSVGVRLSTIFLLTL